MEIKEIAGDTISRAAAIDFVDDVPYIKDHPNIGLLWKAWVEQLPSVQPERKKGKWINVRHDNVAECDQCGITGRAWMNFCFDCGADMREDGEADG